MFWKILLSSILIFTPPVTTTSQATYIEEEITTEAVTTISKSGGSGGGRHVYPRLEFPGREVPVINLSKGSGVTIHASYLAGFDQSVPALIKSVSIQDVNIVEVRKNKFNIAIWGREHGETTVTVDVYHEFYDDIWVSTTVPVTVTGSVYGQ